MNTRLILIILLSILVYTANIGETSIYILDEAKNAGCAMEMYQHKNLIVPTFNGELRTDKPPLHYFFMQAAFSVFGTSPFSARLFSSIMGVLTILSTFLFVGRLVNENVAFLASLILIASIQLSIQFHLAVPDPYLIFFLTTGLLSFFMAWKTGKNYFFYLFYVTIAFAALAKGPIAIVFPGVILFIFLLIRGDLTLKKLNNYKFWQGVLLFTLIALPWYILVGIETDGVWIDQFFFKHNLSRFTKTMEGHRGFPFASLVIVIVGLLPFSLFIPQGIKDIWKVQRTDPFIQFCLIAVGVIVTFFAFSKTILPTYPEPAIPFFAIVLAHYLNSCINESLKSRKFWINAFVYFIITLALPFVVWIALEHDRSLHALTSLSYYFIILIVGSLAGLVYILKGDLKSCLYSYIASIVVFMLLFFYIIFPQVDKKNPVTQSMPVLYTNRNPIAYYKAINPAYIFTLQSKIQKLTTPEQVRQYLENNSRAYLISQKRYMPELEQLKLKIVFEGQDLFETPITVVLKK